MVQDRRTSHPSNALATRLRGATDGLVSERTPARSSSRICGDVASDDPARRVAQILAKDTLIDDQAR
jgi:hypothetical protein